MPIALSATSPALGVAWTASAAFVLVLGSALVLARRRAGVAAGEQDPLVARPHAAANAERAAARRAPALAAIAATCALGAWGVRRTRTSTDPSATAAAATGCWSSDEQLLAGAYDLPGLGGLGLPRPPAARAPITTSSTAAQRLFDQGLVLAFGFNHHEASRNFRAAARADPDCAMCYWGDAYVHGPYVNEQMSAARAALAREALDAGRGAAARLGARGTPLSARETAYLDALDARYPPAPVGAELERDEQRARDRAYARAMAALSDAHPADVDARALHAEARMDLSPWDYYLERATQARRPARAELRAESARAYSQLEAALRDAPRHPLALHLLIHLTEASATPSDGLPAAHALAAGAGGAANSHLAHMAGHSFLALGRYADVTRANQRAVAADEALAARCLEPYLPGHQLAQLQAGAIGEGREQLALGVAPGAQAIDAPSQARHIQGLLPLPRPLVRARFGRWAEVLGADADADAPFLARVDAQPFTAALWSYARALALAHSGRLDEAEAEAARLRAHAAAIPPPTLPRGHVFDASLVQLGALMNATVAAALALRAPGAEPAAAAAAALPPLRAAAQLQDSLPYMEPEHWYLPVRLCLAAVLLRAGDVSGARAELREDVRQHPHSPWALAGLLAAARAAGDAAGAAELEPLASSAWASADRRMGGPCCELGEC